MDSPSDIYCIDHKRPKFLQFLLMIKIEPNSEAAEGWKSRLHRQVSKHLDIKKTTTQQVKQMCKIEQELEISYPDTFSGEHTDVKLRCAMTVVVRFHSTRRSLMFLKERKLATKKDAHYQIIENVEDSDIIDLTHEDSETESKPKSVPLRSTKKSKQPSTSLETERRHTTMTMSPPAVRSKVKIEEQEQIIHGVGISFVFEFLSKCKPSMAFLLHVFLQYGCESEDHIRAVAKWNPKKREEWLVELLNHKVLSTGRRLGEADIRRLSDRFAMCA